MNKNIAKLIELATENPDLPIVAMVDGEIVGDDDFGRWLGSFGAVELGEYTLYDDHFISDRKEFIERYYDRNDDILCEKFKYDPRINEFTVKRSQYTQAQYEANTRNETKLNKHLEELAEKTFRRAIIVNIGFPGEASE